STGAAATLARRKHRDDGDSVRRLVDGEAVGGQLALEVVGEEAAVDVAVNRLDRHRAGRNVNAQDAAKIGIRGDPLRCRWNGSSGEEADERYDKLAHDHVSGLQVVGRNENRWI